VVRRRSAMEEPRPIVWRWGGLVGEGTLRGRDGAYLGKCQ